VSTALTARQGIGAEVRALWYPLAALVRREVQRRYATTALGLGWTLLQPLVLIGVYLLVFGSILASDAADPAAPSFTFFLLTGMLPYLAVSEGIQRASGALREDRALFDREAFPATVVPASRVVAATVTEVAALALVLAVGLALGELHLSPWLAALPLVIALRIVITCGYAWLVSVLTVFITDLGEALGLLLTAWLFLTPIFYRVDQVPAGLRWMLAINPLHAVVQGYRAVLLEARAPWPEVAWLAAWAVLIGGIGAWFYRAALDRAKDFL
jgi:ABC-type polysaccharide/polyol phosphate export permease